ncbi:endoribonuclease Dicer, variant 2 [Dionaea muscipula]
MGDDGHIIIENKDSADEKAPPVASVSSARSWGGEAESAHVASDGQVFGKDPRKIARKYQLELCKRALEENVIVYLETGCGKTHIAVLLIYEMGCLIKKPQKQICVFLAPTVALAHQQAGVIADSIDFTVGLYAGDIKLQKSHDEWEKELERYEILVMTPQLLLQSLRHCFIRMNMIALLIFDECHYGQAGSHHPYAEIMKVYYHGNVGQRPRIFGMTASPVLGKGASIDSLETLLHAKVCTVGKKEELEKYVSSPVIRLFFYRSNTKGLSNKMYMEKKLEEIRRQCTSMLCRNADSSTNILRVKKLLRRTHNNLVYCLGCLGVWGALRASRVLLNGDEFERNESSMEANESSSDHLLCNGYLEQATFMFNAYCMEGANQSDISGSWVLKEPFFSAKVLKLIEILSNFRARPNMKCIVFVSRIVVARSLSYILKQLKILSFWRSGFLVGQHSGLKGMSRKNTENILEQFCSGELNLLVATKVGEEGLDVQTCCLVIRFDLPETVASFIQSRGRARMPQSEFAFLVDSDNENEKTIIDVFLKEEQQMNIDIMTREPRDMVVNFEEKVYKVESTGATISVHSSISLLHHYCSKLPHDEYYKPKPEFLYVDDVDGTVCHVILPANAPIHQIASIPQSSIEAAKKDACLNACKELHQIGVLSDYLLPYLDTVEEGSALDVSDSDSGDDEDARCDVHEMLVPAALTRPWDESKEPVCLNSYFIKFTAKPRDRHYKEFGLFIKSPLHCDAEKLKLDLHLAHGRSVITELIPSGIAQFDEEETLLAQNFQEMFLKMVLDRSDFAASFVPLGKDRISGSESYTIYLLLPVIWNQYKCRMSVDWKVIRRCLSSSTFNASTDLLYTQIPQDGQLQLVDGPARIDDIVNSLVYVVHKNSFFFVSQILPGKNSYSSFDGSKSHVEHLSEVHHIHLRYPEQPLLLAKQLFYLHNLLRNRKQGNPESHALEEHFFELPPEVCQLKILGFTKEIGSSVSLLPSIMHRLENLLVAIELRNRLADSFPEGAEVTSERVLEALTTEKCIERFSLERLEVLGDAFLKFAVSRHLFLVHGATDEGQLTAMRSRLINNKNLYKLAIRRRLQVYIRDHEFDPQQFFALGRPCTVICTKETEKSIHDQNGSRSSDGKYASEVRCNKNHRLLQRKTIADVVEALIGAYVVDSGFKAAISFLKWIGIRADFEISQVIHACTSDDASFMRIEALLDIPSLESSLAYSFLRRGLLLQAFIHPSYNNHGGGCYQRLEFLGDAVMDYLITSYLYSGYPKLKPGQLTDLRSALVSNASFARVAVNRSFYKHLICDSPPLRDAIDKYVNYVRNPDAEQDQLEEPPCPKVLGDLVESSIGAVVLDTGFDLNRVWKLVLSLLDPMMSFSRLQFNPVRELTELCQCFNWDLKFSASKKNKCFIVEAQVDCKKIGCPAASATNRSCKTAKRMAAQQVLATLQAEGYKAKTKSLEEILKISPKMDARLVGFDETPISVSPPPFVSKLESLSLEDPPSSSYPGPKPKPKPCPMKSQETVVHRSPIRETSSSMQDGVEKSQCSPSSTWGKKRIVEPEPHGSSRKVTAKSMLVEICASNCWKPPLFECCKEEGPSHLRLFTYKVVVLIEDAEQDTLLECFGEPHAKKKVASEHAADAALWLLKKEKYI